MRAPAPLSWLSRWLDRRIDARIARAELERLVREHALLKSARRSGARSLAHADDKSRGDA